MTGNNYIYMLRYYIGMMSQLKTPSTPSYPKVPYNRNYIPFENPKSKCTVDSCPSFSTAWCNLCELHCNKFHKTHPKDNRNRIINELTDKYLNRHNNTDDLIKKYSNK